MPNNQIYFYLFIYNLFSFQEILTPNSSDQLFKLDKTGIL